MKTNIDERIDNLLKNLQDLRRYRHANISYSAMIDDLLYIKHYIDGIHDIMKKDNTDDT